MVLHPLFMLIWGIRWFILVLPTLLLKDLNELMFGNPWKNMKKSRHRLNNILVHPWAWWRQHPCPGSNRLKDPKNPASTSRIFWVVRISNRPKPWSTTMMSHSLIWNHQIQLWSSLVVHNGVVSKKNYRFFAHQWKIKPHYFCLTLNYYVTWKSMKVP